MAYPTKIATCCYCGTRAALVLTGRDRHELACSRCGAPLHDLKMLPKKPIKADHDTHDKPPRAISHRPPPKTVKRKKTKRRKIRWGKMFEDVFDDAFDIIEDIFD